MFLVTRKTTDLKQIDFKQTYVWYRNSGCSNFSSPLPLKKPTVISIIIFKANPGNKGYLCSLVATSPNTVLNNPAAYWEKLRFFPFFLPFRLSLSFPFPISSHFPSFPFLSIGNPSNRGTGWI